MAANPSTERLRFTPLSAVRAVALFGLTLVILRLFAAAGRVIGWVLVAASLAGLLHPAVALLARRLPRGVAVVLVALTALSALGVAGYGLVGDVVEETRNLQEALPRQAAELERSERFGDLAQEFDLARRTRRFVDEVPERLRGGTPAEAFRAAATRGVAFLATGILTLFFLLHGPSLARAAVTQVHDPDRRARAQRVALDVFRRSFGYARGSLVMALAAGLLAWVVASLADVPGPAPLAVWVALWDLVPLVGTFLGSLPIVALAAAHSTGEAVLVAGVFLAYQVFEATVLQRRLERRTVGLGPFVTLAGGVAGLELYGLAGVLLTLLLLTVAVAVADDLTPQPSDTGAVQPP